MSQSVVCSGCGTRLEVSEDYTRKKMRCRQCGVIFDLPDPSQRSSIPAKAAPRSAPPATLATRPPDKKPAPMAPAPAPRKRVAEPTPGSSTSVKAPSPAPARPSPPVETFPDDSDDDEFAFFDGKDTPAYQKTGEEIRECPYCHATVHPDAIACSACGFMLTSQKTERTGHSLERRWETGWTFRRRLVSFFICQGIVVALFFAGIVAGMSPFAFLFPYALFTGMTAFLFGSYNWVDLVRNKKGKLRLTQTWRICFFLRPTTTLRVRDYEELAAGAEGRFGATNWIVVLFLIIWGVFAGLVVGFFLGMKILFLAVGGVFFSLVWWLFTWHKTTYYLSLCRDHGYPVETLYRGWDREKMEDMAETISKVARLPLRR